MLQDFCLSLPGAAGDSQLAEINQTSAFISPYQANRVAEFSSMSGPGQNEHCEALSEQNDRVLTGDVQALSRYSFPALLNWSELSVPGPWGGWRHSCLHSEQPLKLFAKVSAPRVNRKTAGPGPYCRCKMTPRLLIIFKMELFCDLSGCWSTLHLPVGDLVELLRCDSRSSRPYFRPLRQKDLRTKTVKCTPCIKLQA